MHYSSSDHQFSFIKRKSGALKNRILHPLTNSCVQNHHTHHTVHAKFRQFSPTED